MSDLLALLDSPELAPGLAEESAVPLAKELGKVAHMTVYWHSITAAHNALFFLGQVEGARETIHEPDRTRGRGPPGQPPTLLLGRFDFIQRISRRDPRSRCIGKGN